MPVNYFVHKETVVKNLISFMRLKGYSRLSLSKLSGIERPAVDQILNGQNANELVFNSQIMQINQTFDLPDDYFLTTQIESISSVPLGITERNAEAQELLDGLDNILDIYSIYVK